MWKKRLRLTSGDQAEKNAAEFLKKQGCKILGRNQHFKVGELDIIAEDGDQTVFAEVKYRANSSHGSAAEMVTAGKQQRLQKAALAWIQINDPKMQRSCRFDVIAMDGDASSIEWIKNAF